ncbi:copper resistance protein CopC [Microbacterium sp. P06]|uniref:copper resistance CopC family protein n=1 Tax=Microbacterium sp. P06 TaxID=3366949 RepID=UPI0037467E7D
MTSLLSHTRRRAPWVLAAGLLTVFAVFAPVSAVSAHDQLVSTDPSADAVLDALPSEITLGFSAELLGDGGANVVEVTDAAGTALADGPAVVDGTFVTQALTGAASGPITVLWRVVSSDGHPISGEFAFTVEGAAVPTPEPTETTPSASPEPTMTTMTTPAETPEPSATDDPSSDASAAGPLPWVVGAIVLVAVIAVVLYLLVIRPRSRNGSASAGSGTSTDD